MSKANYDKANKVVRALLQGIDPGTGQALPSESVLNRVEVVRPMMTASAALQDCADRVARRLRACVNATAEPAGESARNMLKYG